MHFIRFHYRSIQVLVYLSLLLLGCSAPQSDQVISETAVIQTVQDFFNGVRSYLEEKDSDLINEVVTEDIILYEDGTKMNLKELLQFFDGFTVLESDWELSDFRVSTDINSAHVSLLNTGKILLQTDTANVMHDWKWLESAYMVKDNGKLKIKFYFSDSIFLQTNPEE
jgi:uncharacterized lipoprotein YajG